MSKLAIREMGQGETILFIHGTPTCSHEYREVFQILSNRYHCFAVDHLGFGSSEKPRNGDYRLSAHQERLKNVLRENEIRSFHLVVHDFGGVIGLPLLADSQFEVKSLTLLNTWAWPLIETEPQIKYQAWAVKIGLLDFLYRHANFSPRVLLKMAWGQRVPLDPQLYRFYMDQFPKADDRSGTIGFLHALFDFQNPAWQIKPSIERIHSPVMIVWGSADKLISKRNLERWRDWLPQATVHELDDVGHFVAEEAPQQLAEHLHHFIRGMKTE
jgi:pimeloyl-ACP methyl ester carboxylesterase